MTISELINLLKNMKRVCGRNTVITISGLDGRGKFIKEEMAPDKIKITTTAKGFLGFRKKYTIDLSVFGEEKEE